MTSRSTFARLLALWFRVDVPVSRRAYALSGFGLMAFKYAVEVVTIHSMTGRWLSPLVYLNPLLSVRQVALRAADWLLWPLAVWTLPFLWIGVSMTLRRAEDAGLSSFLALVYFVPLANYALMLALCALPARPRPARTPAVTVPGARDPLRSALLGIGLAVGLALLMVGASVLVFGAYGTILFAATPFVMGAASAYAFNRGAPRRMAATMLVAVLAVTMAGGAILLFALEGLVCLAMAAPLALALALMGALVGRWIALNGSPLVPRPVAMVLLLPLLAGIEGRRSAGLVEVVSRIEVNAPPERVWPHVVAVSELPEPPGWIFRLGVAYPRRARIEGRGPGAQRRCEFSTGPFVEPITVWQEPTRLAFDVVAQPPPMEEWSPYRHVLARHLDGYLRVRKGEFRLERLPGGRTRLSGSTWYEMDIAPAAYWSLWSDVLIHAIHQRVLDHVKRLAEEGFIAPSQS